MDYTSRFLTIDDKQLKDMDGFLVPDEWWSRGYEYYFASQFLNKKDIILDAACGIQHPFKYYAAKRVKKCYAIDEDERINDLKGTDKLTFRQLDLVNLEKEFECETFDKIFCISVFEHIPDQALEVLNNFKKLIKPGGLIIMTLDHPFMMSDHFVSLVNLSGLQFVADVDYKIPKNVVHGPYNGLKVYTAILTKESTISSEINKFEEKPAITNIEEVKPTETKPLPEMEIK
jgi:SAM-dependent methyltransferase